MEVGLCWLVDLGDWFSGIGMVWVRGEDDEQDSRSYSSVR